MPSMNWPSNINAEKLAEVSLAILSLTLHGGWACMEVS